MEWRGVVMIFNNRLLIRFCQVFSEATRQFLIITRIQDIIDLIKLQSDGVVGAIAGKALYAGTLDLKKAIALARSSAG